MRSNGMSQVPMACKQASYVHGHEFELCDLIIEVGLGRSLVFAMVVVFIGTGWWSGQSGGSGAIVSRRVGAVGRCV